MEEKTKKVALLARIDPELREKFRIKTIREKTTMAEVVEKFVEDYTRED